MKTNSSSNRVALVTGGSRGIGAAIVRRLIQEEVAVAFTYSSAQEKALTLVAEIEGRGARALAIQADSANATEVRDAVSKTVEAFGRLNILVNNAGILLRGTIDTFPLRTSTAWLRLTFVRSLPGPKPLRGIWKKGVALS
jgi:3-oxoacyl-[acyl-carrier protein] reductase